jgi:2-polyprenyl-3-methyl-5-hydroxy-6-metoxy-1,4-benzoquinol methylase
VRVLILELVFLRCNNIEMNNLNNSSGSTEFLNSLVEEISTKDKLHAKKIKGNISSLVENYPNEFAELLGLVRSYFDDMGLKPDRIAGDYLKMIKDMRIEGLYFYKHGKYRCESQHIANQYVYSKPEVMNYYMNALLVSQIMWKHHFNVFMYFQKQMQSLLKGMKDIKILDVGPGHGFFSFLIKKEFPEYRSIDIVDISETSLDMTKRIVGLDSDKIKYYKADIFDYDDSCKYDFIVLGEVIEHLDEPVKILKKLSNLLNEGGLIWITTPTNSPALDHVYLFKTKDEVFHLMSEAGIDVIDSCSYFAEDMDEETAIKNKITNLVGMFCKKSSS